MTPSVALSLSLCMLGLENRVEQIIALQRIATTIEAGQARCHGKLPCHARALPARTACGDHACSVLTGDPRSPASADGPLGQEMGFHQPARASWSCLPEPLVERILLLAFHTSRRALLPWLRLGLVCRCDPRLCSGPAGNTAWS